MNTIDDLLALEVDGWKSLCDSTGSDFYGRVMTHDALMVLAGGMVMDRDAVVDSLSQAPPWHHFEIEDPRLVQVGVDGRSLVYLGSAWREPDGPAEFVGQMSSTYVRSDDQWRLVLYTQTPRVTHD